jgi:uncharacterized membrane protein YkvA (DUF1232 family)
VVSRLLATLTVTAGVLIVSWAVLWLLARRFPGGALEELARFLPGCVSLLRTLRHDPAVPRRAKVVLVLAALWVLSPIDPIPEFLPVIGPLDDVVVVALALRYAARQVSREVLLAAWPNDPRVLERLLGKPRAAAGHRREP